MLLTIGSVVLPAQADPAPSWTVTSEAGHYRVTLGPADGQALARLPIGRFHVWTARVTDAQGAPVHPADLSVSGGMPAHGHGLPTQPQVTAYMGDGVYRIEGMKFNMAGDWVLALRIATAEVVDTVRLDLRVDY